MTTDISNIDSIREREHPSEACLSPHPQSGTVVFAMRYPDDVGFVWNSMSRVYDLTAAHLREEGDVAALLAFPKLSNVPAYRPVVLDRAQVDFYDTSPQNRPVIESLVRERNVNTVVYMGCDPASVDLAWLRRLGLKTISYEQDSYPPDARQPSWKLWMKDIVRRRLQYNLHDCYVANADHQRQFLLDFARLPSQRVVTVVNGVDVDSFFPGPPPDPQSFGLPLTEYYALSVCQAREEKRVDLLIDIAQRVFKHRPNLLLTFVHVGAGPCLSQWKELVVSLGLEERFRFLGFHNNVASLHRLATFLVHAAERESFGFVLAEAMATGKPVIATRSQGPAEIVVNGETGYLVSQDDPESFAGHIIALSEGTEIRQSMGMRAVERTRKYYSLNRQSEQLANLILRQIHE